MARRVTVRWVQESIAASVLDGSGAWDDPLNVRDHRRTTAEDSVGGFTLRPAQRRTRVALRAAIAEFGGALLADPPGTGKTVLALAAAEGAGQVLVIAPSNLRAQWLAASARAAVPISFTSLESASRTRFSAPADFVIIDEAHHLRTTTTRRYAHVSAVCVGARVLLLSATPVVNRTADRDALLALFLGSRAERLPAAALGRCVVRRRESGDARPTLRRIGAIPAHLEVAGIGDALRRLPSPLPLVGGAPATALIRMSLAMAWQSSLAALDAALRRRIQRGGAMEDLLRAGRMPSHAALRQWISNDDATQLALPLLIADSAPSVAPEAMLETLGAHLEAVRELRHLIGPHRAGDAARRADAIRALLTSHPGRRVVVFARHAETVRALYAAFRGLPGVVAIVGTRVRTASGRWTRDEVLRALGPHAGDPDPRDARAIRLLLTTDALAEGVEMQGVGLVVHADLPWTPARLEQRVGRVVRVGSRAREVCEAWFTAPRGARALVRLGARLSLKAQLRRRAVRDADARGEIGSILERWHGRGSARSPDRLDDGDGDAPLEAVVEVAGTRSGFVAVTRERDGPRLVCGVYGRVDAAQHDGQHRNERWRVSSSPRCVLAVLRMADAAEKPAAEPLSSREAPKSPGAEYAVTARQVRDLLARVLTRRAALGLAGTSSGERHVPRVRKRLARLLERAPALARRALAERHEELMRALASPLETAREQRVDQLLRADIDDAAFARRLGAVLRDRMRRDPIAPDGGPALDITQEDACDVARTAPLLILRRASAPTAARAPAPTSASPGTAAPR
jgi:hypothetical protein